MHVDTGTTRLQPLTRRELREADTLRRRSRNRRAKASVPSGAARTRSLAGRDATVAGPRQRVLATAVSLRSAIGVLATALFVVPYTLPSYAQPVPVDPGSVVAPLLPKAQSVEVPEDVALAQPTERDGFRVTKALPAGVNAYAQTADTFVNDADSPIQWPFTQGVPISSYFGYRVPPCPVCSSDHKGLDMNPGFGTPIQAMADGVVTEVGDPGGTYGVYAIIDHVIDGRKFRSIYAHMDYGSLAVQVGDRVQVGDLVGQVGSSGLSTGAHLHFELRQGDVPIDPYAWLKARVGS